MKILNHLKSGLSRSVRSWKGVMIIWIFFLFLVALYALPLRSTLYSSFGKSMITEKLASGFDLEAFTDLGPAFRSLISFFSGGFLLIVIAGFIINAFLTGGLFSSFREKTGRFSPSEFFRASARNFWPFLIILFIITLFVCLISGLIISVASIIVSSSETLSERNSFIIVFAAVLIVLILLPVFLLIADYSRAWMVSNEGGSCFKALGFGFNQTFRKFWSSYTLMLILVSVQILFGLIAVSIFPSWRPVTGAGVFIMFIISQLMIYARLFLKSWRYSSITSLTETYRNITN